MSRVLVWFSCGAASAVAAKLAVEKYGKSNVVVVYCDTSTNEHPDNIRFRYDVERWIGSQVRIIGSSKYTTCEQVFDGERYISGPLGARCTLELKKKPRLDFQRKDDKHLFGFTCDEWRRVMRFQMNNADLKLDWILVEHGITKQDCFKEIASARIRMPEMYLLGYRNNNCLGCVKSTSPGYWNKVRMDFPEVFERRARQSRALGVRLVEYHGERIFLDELPEGVGRYDPALENISCGPDCGSHDVVKP